jgi:hypothetical protein
MGGRVIAPARDGLQSRLYIFVCKTQQEKLNRRIGLDQDGRNKVSLPFPSTNCSGFLYVRM